MQMDSVRPMPTLPEADGEPGGGEARETTLSRNQRARQTVSSLPVGRRHSTCGLAFRSKSSGSSPYGKEATYRKMERLGEGSYATVFKGFSEILNTTVAMKEITLNSEEGTPFTAIREASLLKGLKHANIVILHDIIHTKTKLSFIFEYLDTDISKFMEDYPRGLPIESVRLLMFQLLRGLDYCHKRHILHRDLKPQNLLLNQNGELKLADFGLARAKSVPSKTYSHEVVTLWYRPPDVLLGSTDYTTTLDMWGVGCILGELVSGVAMFPGQKDATDQLRKIWQVLGTPTPESWPQLAKFTDYSKRSFTPVYPEVRLVEFIPNFSQCPEALDLCSKLLKYEAELRLRTHDSIAHPFFACLPQDLFYLPAQESIYSVRGVKFCSGLGGRGQPGPKRTRSLKV